MEGKCPSCACDLRRVVSPDGVFWGCVSCQGRSVGVALLRKVSAPQIVEKIWMEAGKARRAVGKVCPSCIKPMVIVPAANDLVKVELDVCRNCYSIWFDKKEIDKIPRATEQEMTQRKREAEKRHTKAKNRESDDAINNDIHGEMDLAWEALDTFVSSINWFD